jgi:ribosomal protein L7Ae-like RNA K-turn-binding protein
LCRCAKVLDKGVARLCVLATNCDVDAYKKLVKALCESKNIPIIEVETHALLGEWCGLCKLDKEGNARKVRLPRGPCVRRVALLRVKSLSARQPANPNVRVPCYAAFVPCQVAKCSVAVVTDFGESSHEVNVVLGHVKKQ